MSSRGGRSDTTDTETRTFRDPSTRPPHKRTKPKPTNQPLCHNHQTDDVTTTTMTMKHENDTTTNNKQTNNNNKQTNNNNKTTNNLKSRATAKEQVANVWKERRQHSHTCHADQTAAPSQLQQQKQLQQQQKQLQKQQQQPMVGLFSLCGMVQKAWDDWKVARLFKLLVVLLLLLVCLFLLLVVLLLVVVSFSCFIIIIPTTSTNGGGSSSGGQTQQERQVQGLLVSLVGPSRGHAL